MSYQLGSLWTDSLVDGAKRYRKKEDRTESWKTSLFVIKKKRRNRKLVEGKKSSAQALCLWGSFQTGFYYSYHSSRGVFLLSSPSVGFMPTAHCSAPPRRFITLSLHHKITGCSDILAKSCKFPIKGVRKVVWRQHRTTTVIHNHHVVFECCRFSIYQDRDKLINHCFCFTVKFHFTSRQHIFIVLPAFLS